MIINLYISWIDSYTDESVYKMYNVYVRSCMSVKHIISIFVL